MTSSRDSEFSGLDFGLDFGVEDVIEDVGVVVGVVVGVGCVGDVSRETVWRHGLVRRNGGEG